MSPHAAILVLAVTLLPIILWVTTTTITRIIDKIRARPKTKTELWPWCILALLTSTFAFYNTTKFIDIAEATTIIFCILQIANFIIVRLLFSLYKSSRRHNPCPAGVINNLMYRMRINGRKRLLIKYSKLFLDTITIVSGILILYLVFSNLQL